MSVERRCTTSMRTVLSDLAILRMSLVALETQWERFRDHPDRTSPHYPTQVIYIAALDRWYSVDLPRDRAALLERIHSFWEHGSGDVWQKLATELLHKLVGTTLLKLRPLINQCNEEWKKLEERCYAACEVWEDLVKLELTESNHVYFVGERLGRLRRLPDTVDKV